MTFQILTAWEKHKSRNEETESMFVKITILQYFNLAIVLILINFKINIIDVPTIMKHLITFLNKLSVFNGKYEDFS